MESRSVKLDSDPLPRTMAYTPLALANLFISDDSTAVFYQLKLTLTWSVFYPPKFTVALNDPLPYGTIHRNDYITNSQQGYTMSTFSSPETTIVMDSTILRSIPGCCLQSRRPTYISVVRGRCAVIASRMKS
jgi:hypothetical protein